MKIIKQAALLLAMLMLCGSLSVTAWAEEMTTLIDTTALTEEESSIQAQSETSGEPEPLLPDNHENETKTPPAESAKKVIDIDPGDYQSTMTVGTTQLLMPTAIYDDHSTSPDSVYTYSSSKKSVATVNALGRITAVKKGTATISIKCKGYTKKITIKVEKPVEAEEPKPIAVTDLDFGDYQETLEVGKTMSLSVSVIPSTATEQTVTYKSSNTQIATVNGNGRVTGVSSGTVKITASSGKVKKSINLKVEIKTEGISVDESYVVLKPNEEQKIHAVVTPSNAPQKLTYTTSDEKVVTVSDKGVIHAVASGNATIVVTNGSGKAVISVIVNQNTQEQTEDTNEEEEKAEEEPVSPIVQEILSGDEKHEFFTYCEEYPVVTSDILQALYGTDRKLTVVGDGYHLTICGKDIKNIENELNTIIKFDDDGKMMSFLLNDGNGLPGKVQIVLDEREETYRWLYLYNDSLDKWQLLNSYQNATVTADSAGLYSLRQKKITLWGINWWAVSGCCVLLIAGVGIYIWVKKKYWFW